MTFGSFLVFFRMMRLCGARVPLLAIRRVLMSSAEFISDSLFSYILRTGAVLEVPSDSPSLSGAFVAHYWDPRPPFAGAKRQDHFVPVRNPAGPFVYEHPGDWSTNPMYSFPSLEAVFDSLFRPGWRDEFPSDIYRAPAHPYFDWNDYSRFTIGAWDIFAFGTDVKVMTWEWRPPPISYVCDNCGDIINVGCAICCL